MHWEGGKGVCIQGVVVCIQGEGDLHPGDLHPGGGCLHPDTWILQDMVNKPAVRILLECILVQLTISSPCAQKTW